MKLKAIMIFGLILFSIRVTFAEGVAINKSFNSIGIGTQFWVLPAISIEKNIPKNNYAYYYEASAQLVIGGIGFVAGMKKFQNNGIYTKAGIGFAIGDIDITDLSAPEYEVVWGMFQLAAGKRFSKHGFEFAVMSLIEEPIGIGSINYRYYF